MEKKRPCYIIFVASIESHQIFSFPSRCAWEEKDKYPLYDPPTHPLSPKGLGGGGKPRNKFGYAMPLHIVQSIFEPIQFSCTMITKKIRGTVFFWVVLQQHQLYFISHTVNLDLFQKSVRLIFVS